MSLPWVSILWQKEEAFLCPRSDKFDWTSFFNNKFCFGGQTNRNSIEIVLVFR